MNFLGTISKNKGKLEWRYFSVFKNFKNEKLWGHVFLSDFVFCKVLANNKGKILDFVAKKLFAFTQVWHGLGVWKVFLILNLFAG